MEFNDNQAEILSQAVERGFINLPLTDYVPDDVSSLVRKGFLVWSWRDTHVLEPTSYGRAVVQVYAREQAAYQRGYDEGYYAGVYS